MTCKQLQDLLKQRSQPVSGKKVVLINRLVRSDRAETDTEQISESQPLSQPIIIPADVRWTDSLIGFSDIDHSIIMRFKASDRHCKSGYALFKSNKVENILVADVRVGLRLCKNMVAGTMKSDRYDVTLRFADGNVSSKCKCVAGKGKCKHAVALLCALSDLTMSEKACIPATVACTSQPQQWGRVTSKPVLAGISSFVDLSPHAVRRDPGEDQKQQRQEQRVKKRMSCSSVGHLPPLSSQRCRQAAQHHPFLTAIINEQTDTAGNSTVEVSPRCVPALSSTDPDNLLTTMECDNIVDYDDSNANLVNHTNNHTQRQPSR